MAIRAILFALAALAAAGAAWLLWQRRRLREAIRGAGVAPRLADGPHFLIDGHEYSYLARAGGAAKLCRTYDEAIEFVEARSHDW